MRHRPAHGIDGRVADDQVEIGAVRAERIVAGRADLRAGLPPAVLAARDARLQGLVERPPRADAALRRLPRHPVARLDPTLGGCHRVQLDLWIALAAAQARQAAVLGLAELR